MVAVDEGGMGRRPPERAGSIGDGEQRLSGNLLRFMDNFGGDGQIVVGGQVATGPKQWAAQTKETASATRAAHGKQEEKERRRSQMRGAGD